MTFNLELAEEVLEVIETFPEDWDQGEWVAPCGTTFCFAGHAAIRSHPTWKLEYEYSEWYNKDIATMCMVNSKGERMGLIEDIATKDLGLSYQQANLLFSANNSLDRLKSLVRDFSQA